MPQDVTTLKDDQFYSLIEKLTSPDVARIFKCQFVNSMNTFLLCKNILTPILLPTPTFDAIRRDVCVKLNQNHNHSYVVHVGITGQIEYLTELFQRRHLQEAKNAAKYPLLTATAVANASSLCTQLSSATIDIGSSSTATSIVQSDTDHRSNIVSSIDRWITQQQTSSGSSGSRLVEGKDYLLHISSAPDAAVVVCRCKVRIAIAKATDSSFSLSNLYKHWKTSKRCDLLASTRSHSSISRSTHNSSSAVDYETEEEEERFPCSPSTVPIPRTASKRTASSDQTMLEASPNKRRRHS